MNYIWVIFSCLIIFFTSKESLSVNISDSAVEYINSVNNFSASFKQVSGNGEDVAFGKVYILRPFIKWIYEYEDDTVELVFNGSTVSYYDKNMKEVNTFMASGGFRSIFSDVEKFVEKMEYVTLEKVSNKFRVNGREIDTNISFSLWFNNMSELSKMEVDIPNEPYRVISFFDIEIGNIDKNVFSLTRDGTGDF